MVRGDNHTTASRALLGALCAALSCGPLLSCAKAPAAPPDTAAAPPSEPAHAASTEVRGEVGHDSAASGSVATVAPRVAVAKPLYEPTDKPWLGIEMRDLEPGQAGVRIARVFRGSPAYTQGLVADDLLLSIDGKPLSEPRQVNALVLESDPGRTLSVVLSRAGHERLFKIEVGNMPEAEDLARMNFIGMRAPDLAELTPVQGDVARSLGDLSGRVVVLEFWARWCGVCRYLVPIMNRWYSEYRPQGVAMLGLTTDPFELADRTAEELDMRYPIATDLSGETTVAYGANAVPMVFVIDQKGVIRDVMVGLRKKRVAELEKLVEQLLDKG